MYFCQLVNVRLLILVCSLIIQPVLCAFQKLTECLMVLEKSKIKRLLSSIFMLHLHSWSIQLHFTKELI